MALLPDVTCAFSLMCRAGPGSTDPQRAAAGPADGLRGFPRKLTCSACKASLRRPVCRETARRPLPVVSSRHRRMSPSALLLSVSYRACVM